jgi:peptidyl-prolyl cis-trans isomerase C
MAGGRMRFEPRAAGALLLLLAACGGAHDETAAPAAARQPTATAAAATDGGPVIATYSDRRLTTAEVLEELKRLPGPSRAYLGAPERKRQFVENLVMNDLLFDEGRRQGLDRDPEIDRQVNDLRKRLVVQRVMRAYQTPPTIDDDEVRKYYAENQELYSTTQIRASHILVADEATARRLRAELEEHPERFADLARDNSTDSTSARRGGDLGTFAQGRMVADFERAAFRLKPGELSEPVKTQYGWHLIKVTERKDGEPKPFDQVKESIRAMLRNQRLQAQVQDHFDGLKKDANVRIDEAALAKLEPPAGPDAPPAPHGIH